jgi:hypothetical protein
MNLGVFAVDPGGATGLAWGIFNPTLPEVGDQLRTRLDSGSATTEGDERSQIREITTLWAAFYRACVNSALLSKDRVWFICEDFVYTGSNTYSGDSAKISTALIWGVEGYRMGRADEYIAQARGRKRQVHVPSMILQTASQAKSYATNARLKEWECWVVGREHERSAFQHVAYFLKHYQTLGID